MDNQKIIEIKKSLFENKIGTPHEKAYQELLTMKETYARVRSKDGKS